MFTVEMISEVAKTIREDQSELFISRNGRQVFSSRGENEEKLLEALNGLQNYDWLVVEHYNGDRRLQNSWMFCDGKFMPSNY